MLSCKGDRLNQVCETHAKFKSAPVIKGMSTACLLLFGILPKAGWGFLTTFDEGTLPHPWEIDQNFYFWV